PRRQGRQHRLTRLPAPPADGGPGAHPQLPAAQGSRPGQPAPRGAGGGRVGGGVAGRLGPVRRPAADRPGPPPPAPCRPPPTAPASGVAYPVEPGRADVLRNEEILFTARVTAGEPEALTLEVYGKPGIKPRRFDLKADRTDGTLWRAAVDGASLGEGFKDGF